MKVILFTLLSFLFLSFLTAQEDFTHLNKVRPVVKGQLLGYDVDRDDNVTVKLRCYEPGPHKTRTYEIPIDKNGQFEHTFKYPIRFQYFQLSVGGFYYDWYTIDRELLFEVNMKDQRKGEEVIKLSGQDAEMNHYLQHYETTSKPTKMSPSTLNNILRDREATLEEKHAKLDEKFAEELKFEETFIDQNPSPFAWMLTENRLSKNYGSLFICYSRNEMPDSLIQEVLSYQPRQMNKNTIIDYYDYSVNFFYNRLTQSERLTYFKNDLFPTLDSPEKERLIAFLDSLALRILGEDIQSKAFFKESSHFHNRYIEFYKEAALEKLIHMTSLMSAEQGDMVKLIGGGEDVLERRKFTAGVLPTMQTDWARNILQEERKQDQKRLQLIDDRLSEMKIEETTADIGEQIGILPEGAPLFHAKYEEVDSLLLTLRAAYPDKDLILDIWTTWCSPCIGDMQQSAPKLAQLAATDIQVVYLCSSQAVKPEMWQKKVAELNLNAHHIYMNDHLSTRLMERFQLRGFPSHLVIDKEGMYRADVHVDNISRLDLERVQRELRSE